ncbi:MAG TPA: flagellar export chaperone FliS [Verrucomicrobiae bacterium]|jgi:flagellar protein FliS|nr:flagellar export chaperone FliS [Verrucomicrobiae bacterium]
MMPRNKPWESYRRVATQTATPGQLVLMLYDGAIGFSEKAIAGFSHTDPALFNQTISNNILRAQAIIHEMNASLNMQAGGEVSANFRRLYNYLYRRLRDANRAKTKEPIEETIKHLRVLRNSWAEMLRNGGEARYLEEMQAQQAAAA